MTREAFSTADILHRASRPQRHSSFLPTRRDWRYASGIFTHDDHDDTPKQMTVWDELDYDAQTGVFGRGKERRRAREFTRTRSGTTVGADDEDGESPRKVSGEDDEDAVAESPDAMEMDGAMDSPDKVTPTPKSGMKGSGKSAGKRSKVATPSKWHTLASFTRVDEDGEFSEDGKDGEQVWQQTRLVARLNFSPANSAAVERIVSNPGTPCKPARLAIQTTPSTLQKTPRTLNGFTPATPSTLRILTSIEPTHNLPQPLFERKWTDETHNFNMKEVVETIWSSEMEVKDIPVLFNWFPDAVPIDALLPPGIALSAKEILAFYPHHIRWKPLMIRLANNSYLAADMLSISSFFRASPIATTSDNNPAITPAQLNQILRDNLRRTLPGFSTADGVFKGRPDRNLYTDGLRPGRAVEELRGGGFVVPSFEELVTGVRTLPTGLDARDLTQCLVWYVGVRDRFEPPLKLNVLHTQSLVRALRIPVKAHGSRNLDKIALEEWRREGRFVEREVRSKMTRRGREDVEEKKLDKSTVEICPESESVKLDVTVKLRHVLMFPFLCMVGMAAKGIEKGVEKAEERRAETVTQKQKRRDDAQAKDMRVQTGRLSEESITTMVDTPKQPTREISSSYRTPKRKRPIFEDDNDTQPRQTQPPDAPTGPRAMSMPREPSAPRSVTSSFPSPGYWTASSFNAVSHPTSFERYDPSRYSEDRRY